MNYDEAVKWLLENITRLRDSGLTSLPSAYSKILAVLQREHEDAERYRYLLSIGMFRCFSPDISGQHTWTGMGRTLPGRGPTVSDAIDRARKGVSGE